MSPIVQSTTNKGMVGWVWCGVYTHIYIYNQISIHTFTSTAISSTVASPLRFNYNHDYLISGYSSWNVTVPNDALWLFYHDSIHRLSREQINLRVILLVFSVYIWKEHMAHWFLVKDKMFLAPLPPVYVICYNSIVNARVWKRLSKWCRCLDGLM